MTEERNSAAALHRALDGIDSIRRRLLWTGLAAVGLTATAFAWLVRVARLDGDTGSALTAAVFAITCVIAWSTFALALFISRMTQRILRGIDLALKRSAQ